MPVAPQRTGEPHVVKVYLDTNCIIYFVEKHPYWLPKVVARIAAFRAAKDELTVGDLTRAECLVGPFKTSDVGLESRYRSLFGDPDFRVLELTAAVCERAARLRAKYPFKLPDALHLATAIEHGCGLFLTNDAKLKKCTDIPVEVLT
jgi:predicted nucleic acid-binding protein